MSQMWIRPAGPNPQLRMLINKFLINCFRGTGKRVARRGFSGMNRELERSSYSAMRRLSGGPSDDEEGSKRPWNH